MLAKYLLYIDILGFSELVKLDAEAVRTIYRVIDSLHVHQHPGFRTIVFSDTILVYNDFPLDSDEAHRYTVMFCCEFAQDLMYRLVGTGVFFRSILNFGDFEHYKLPNVECFFGSALIRSYIAEKSIPAIGLFMTNECAKHNDIFPVKQFSPDLQFVYLNQSLEKLQRNTAGKLPTPAFYLEDTDEYHRIIWDLHYLRALHSMSRTHPEPLVRAKHLASYDLYRQRYSSLLLSLEQNDFLPDPICPTFDWSDMKQLYEMDSTRFSNTEKSQGD